MSNSSKPASAESLPTFGDSWKADFVSGFLVFLIALPLCLGIAKASLFPPVTGVFTAILGGIVACLFSNSELTIKGPAAGMIAIVAGAMLDPGWLGHDPAATSAGYLETYKFVLAVGVASGVIQIVLGALRAGILTEFFPMAPVHGLLASIGFIIISKQSHVLFGAPSPKEAPLDSLIKLRETIPNAHLHATIIGLSSLALLFAYPWLKKKIKVLGYLPAQLVVLILAIPLGVAFQLPSAMLVPLPDRVSDAIVLPDFSLIATATSMKWILLFCLVGSLESLLSAKAIDILDPWKRKTNMNRDLLGVGVANTAVAAIGGLPMISEILRSSANIANGGRTRLSNLFHGLFLLGAILLLAPLLKMIPLPALGAMLVFAGFRLASPKEFAHMWHLGKEQFIVFVLTVACIFPHGELLLVVVGMAAELMFNLINGVSPAVMFSPRVHKTGSEAAPSYHVEGALAFSNWVPMKKLLDAPNGATSVTIDLSDVKFVDHTAMDKLLQTQRSYGNSGRTLIIAGLADHKAFGHEASSARKLAVPSRN